MKQCLRKLYNVDVAQHKLLARGFSTNCRFWQPPSNGRSEASPAPQLRSGYTTKSSWNENRLESENSISKGNRGRTFNCLPDQSKRQRVQASTSALLDPADVGIFVDNYPHKFKAVLLRDLCECPSCLDPSTKQKLFSTADIPSSIEAREVIQTPNGASILWENDVPGFGLEHKTDVSSEVLRSLALAGFAGFAHTPGGQTLWNAELFDQMLDVNYEAYMQDDAVLYKALNQLHTYGLVIVRNVPESEKSVSTIGERIGPIKNTFYGYTWDVRSVPEAKNVAYTSQNLGFHMDLLYMQQPPHLQILHCIRSSARGGASLFTDSYRAAQELFLQNPDDFSTLAQLEATFHYNHPNSHLYRQQRRVFELGELTLGNTTFDDLSTFAKAWSELQRASSPPGASNPVFNIADFLDHVSWSPPFQGPFSLKHPVNNDLPSTRGPLESLNKKVRNWHRAARKYNALIHRRDGIYERTMRPGECVIFDNRRILHARKAFEVGDAGTERWLRGAYLDKDPYVSKLQVLERKFGILDELPTMGYPSKGGSDEYFEAASSFGSLPLH